MLSEEREIESPVPQPQKRKSFRSRVSDKLDTDFARGIFAKLLASVCALLFSTINPFLTMFYLSLGYNSKEIGLISSIVPFISSITPLWTLIADKTKKHTLVWMLSFSLGFFAQISFLFFNKPFWKLALLVIFMSSVRACVWPMVDARIISLVGTEAYGKQRLFMSFVWGLGALGTSLLVTKFGKVWIIFILHACVAPFFVIIALFIAIFIKPKPQSKEEKEAKNPPSNQNVSVNSNDIQNNEQDTPVIPKIKLSFSQQLIKSFTNIKLIGFLIFCIALGMSHAVPSMLFVYLEERFSVSSNFWLLGADVVVAISLEVPTFYFSGRLIKKFGAFPLMCISIILTGLRIFGYTLVNSVWLILIPEVLHGPMFGLAWASGVTTASSLVPEELQSTGQGLFYFAYSSVGSGLGLFLVGFAFKSIGCLNTFRVCACFCLCILVITLITYSIAKFCCGKQNKHQKLPQDSQNDESESAEPAELPATESSSASSEMTERQ